MDGFGAVLLAMTEKNNPGFAALKNPFGSLMFKKS